jgi:hypothetical protein
MIEQYINDLARQFVFEFVVAVFCGICFGCILGTGLGTWGNKNPNTFIRNAAACLGALLLLAFAGGFISILLSLPHASLHVGAQGVVLCIVSLKTGFKIKEILT